VSVKEFLLRNRRSFAIWAVVGFVVHALLLLYFRPWSADFGVPMDPKRWLIGGIANWWVFRLPLVLLAMSFIAGKPRWLAPRGRYQEGVEYPVFSTYTYVAIALCSALFAASGVVSAFFIDLSAAPATLSVTFFNPIVGFFTLWLGGVVRSLIFGGTNPVTTALGVGASDGATWIFLGIFFWWFREQTKWGKNPVAVLVFWFVVYPIWRLAFLGDFFIWLAPVPAIWTIATQYATQVLPTSVLGSLAGLVASEALIRAFERGEQRGL